MKHKHFISLFYTEGCAPCKVRQIRYGYRLDPEGQEKAIEDVIRSKTFTALERRWILTQVGANL